MQPLFRRWRSIVGATLLLWSGYVFAEIAPAVNLAPGYSGLAYAAPEPGSYALPPVRLAADGTVLDEEGQELALHDLLRGKNSLLAFVYSNCSDVNGCPLAAHVFYQLKVAMQDDPELAEGVQLLSLSFDPERDSPEVMRLYGQAFKYAGEEGNWRFLTTSSEQALAPLLAGYGQERQRELSIAADETVEYAHLLRVFLIDANLQVRNIYGVSFLQPDLLIADVRSLLLEPVTSAMLPGDQTEENKAAAAQRLLRLKSTPLGMPEADFHNTGNHRESEISLGRRLFFDRRLSLNGTFSCAMCHLPNQGFSSNELATSVGLEGRSVRRNAPSLFNVGYAQRLFHDGRDTRLEEQVWSPLLARNEMANPSVGFVIDTLRRLPVYQKEFKQAYGAPANISNIGSALAAYQRSLKAGDSNFDRWHFAADESAVDNSVKRGFALFSGKANCSSCHLLGSDSALFSDWGLHNTGTGYNRSMGIRPSTQRVQAAPGVFIDVDMAIIDRVSEQPESDLGYYEISQNPADRWKYRTPSLRNVGLTAPYMHDGSLRTLTEVVEFYNQGGVANKNLSPLIKPLSLDEQEIADIVAFLQSLTSNAIDSIVGDAKAAPVGDPGSDGQEGSVLGVSSKYKP